MDLSYWSNIPNIRIGNTTKQFYGQYLWRLSLEVHAGRLIYEPKDSDLENLLIRRREVSKRYNQQGWWGMRRHNLEKVDLDLLEVMRHIKYDPSYQIKIRVEEPHLHIYSNSDQELKHIANRIKSKSAIVELTGPGDLDTQRLLEYGVIFRKKATDYKYKIVFRDGRYPTDTKKQILSYLDGLGDIVRVTKGVRKMLESQFSHSWGVYFYTNDTTILTFISLISPTIVSNIHELVVLPNK